MRTRKSQRICSTSRFISSIASAAEFDPQKFEDHYENAVKELLRKKQSGEKIERTQRALADERSERMDAVRQSLQAEGGATRDGTNT